MHAVNGAEKVVVAAYIVPQAAKQTVVNGQVTNTVGFDVGTGTTYAPVLDPAHFAPKSSSLNVGQIAYPNGVPTLVNRRVVLREPTTLHNCWKCGAARWMRLTIS